MNFPETPLDYLKAREAAQVVHARDALQDVLVALEKDDNAH